MTITIGPHVVEYEQSTGSGNNQFTLIDLYDTYEDKLTKYGLLHIQGLCRQVMGERGFERFSQESLASINQWTEWETVLIQGPHMGAFTPMDVKSGVQVQQFEKMAQKQLKKSRALLSGVLCDGVDKYQLYWDTIDYSIKQWLPEHLQPPSDAPMIPRDFTSLYAVQAEKTTAGERTCPMGIPPQWSQHHPDFGGPRNLLSANEPQLSNIILQGITAPYSYYYHSASDYTSFPHHFEDFFLPSVNFMYAGSEKYWIGVPATETRRLWNDLIVGKLAKWTGKRAAEKRFLISPRMLESVGMSVVEVHQMPGDVVISASGATHGGFNLGPNWAEAVNFADRQGKDGWLAMVDEMQEFYMDTLEKSVPSALLDIATQ